MIGDFLRKARNAKGLLLDDVADAVGVTPTTVSRWERGSRNVSPKYFDKISQVLEVDPQKLRKMTGNLPESGQPGYVSSYEELHLWISQLFRSVSDPKLRMILAALSTYIEGGVWVVSIGMGEIEEDTEITKKTLEEVWPQVLSSPLIERVGSAKWAFRLVLPDDDQSGA